jgi:hypothetical protein
MTERIRSGEFTARIERSTVARPECGQPPGTLSQIIHYFDGDMKVAIVHQFLLPDGTIGASGKPDPKMVRQGNTIFKLRPEEAVLPGST